MTRFWTAAAVLLLAAGCAEYQSVPLTATMALESYEKRRLDDPNLRAFLEANQPGIKWPVETWDLNTLTLAAFYFHPELALTRAEADVAEAGILIAEERPNPEIGFTPEFNVSTPHGTISPWIFGFSLNIPIETAGKRDYRMAQARHSYEAVRLKLSTTAWQARSRVRQSLLDYYAASEKEILLGRQQVIQADNVNLLKRQMEAGSISPFEIHQASIALDTTRLALHDAAKSKAAAWTDLAGAVGMSVSAIEGTSLSLRNFQQKPPEIPAREIRRLAMLNRPDILALLSEYAASQAALQLEIAKQYPDVNIGPGYQLDQEESKWSLGISATLPILNQNQGAIAQAKARRAEIAARFVALQARVIGDIDKALANCQASGRKVEDAEALQAELLKREQSVQAMYKAGEINKLEFANARLELNTNELARLDARIEMHQAWGQMEDALQSDGGITAGIKKLPGQKPDAKKEPNP